jgi:hypothetical protein
VPAWSENEVKVENGGDPRKDFEPDAFRQAILDHRPGSLAHAA